jgi:hypothetical protein
MYNTETSNRALIWASGDEIHIFGLFSLQIDVLQ